MMWINAQLLEQRNSMEFMIWLCGPVHVQKCIWGAALSSGADYSSDTGTATITKAGIQHAWSDHHIKGGFLPSHAAYCCSLPLVWGYLVLLQHSAFDTEPPRTVFPSAGDKAALQVSTVPLMSFLFTLSCVCSLPFCHDDPSSIQRGEEATY